MSDSLREISYAMETEMESVHPFNSLIGELVFPYLELKDLLSASRVCKSWKIMTMDKLLWKEIKLKNFMVVDWHKFIDTINERNTMSLCTRDMILPTIINEFHDFWTNFNKAIKKANKLQIIYLFMNPPVVVENILETLPQLKVLHALSIIKPYHIDGSDNVHNYMNLDLSNVSQLINLTELKLKGITNTVFNVIPKFNNLKELKTLSLTSSESIFNPIWNNLNTISTGLMHLEIGDCKYMSEEFAVALKRFDNLTFLKLENYNNNMGNITQEIFKSIRSLKNLTRLELVNINCDDYVINELEKCDKIKMLFINPLYYDYPTYTNHNLIYCFKILSDTLTNLIWGISNSHLLAMNEILSQSDQPEFENLSGTFDHHIPILSETQQLLSGNNNYVNDDSPNENINIIIITIETLENLLNQMMPNVYTKLITLPL